MSNFSEQLEQIKTLISSTTKSEKSFAYSTLQDLQEQLSDNKSLIPSFLDSTQILLSAIITDIRDSYADSDEEIVSLALKCLGFMIYHPSIVAAITKEYVDQVLESLTRLIMMTKVKLVCNLGVWCVSIQQLDASSLTSHFDSLLMAIVHSLDNPLGSLSTTFEAIQAVMKLATQMSEKMRDTSSIWAPPIYRRLTSNDKREREICLRCLLKIKCVIVPPPLALSKAVAKDMTLKLIPGMKELLKHGKKVQALQAWRWFICLLGSYSLKARHLVNEMLKVPEQTFSDPDPQARNASLDAWEGLIEALVCPPLKVVGAVTIHHHQDEQNEGKSVDPSGVHEDIIQTREYSKSLKLIMKPLIGIMTSKADLSVQTSCLSTWCYLLHKLDSAVNHPHVLDTVLEPMFKVVFSVGLVDENIWIWRFCINLFQDFIQRKLTKVACGSVDHSNCNLSARASDSGSHVSRECSLKSYFVNWLPWDYSQMDFLLRVTHIIFNQLLVSTSCLENRRLVSDTVVGIFHSFLKGFQMDFAKSSTTYYSVMQSMNSVLMFVKMVCETALQGDDASEDFQAVCLRLLGAVTQELAPSILGSPLYKFALDLKYISDLQLASVERCKMLMGTNPIHLMDMVSPMIYLTVFFSSLVMKFTYKGSNTEFIQQEAYNYFNNLLTAYDSLEVLHAVVAVMYVFVEHSSLLVWTVMAKSLRDYIHGAKDLSPLDIQPSSSGSLTVCHFLLYPFICSSQNPMFARRHPNPFTDSMVSSENMALEQEIELWMSLYCLFNSSDMRESPKRNLFAGDLCSSLIVLFQRNNVSESVSACYNSQDRHICSLCGDIAKCILENLNVEKVTPEAIKFGYTRDSGITNCLVFLARVMELLWTGNGEAQIDIAISRLLPPLTHFVGSLQWQEDVLSLIKVLREPLLHWLSDMEMKCESIKHQLQLFWIEIIKTLQHSWPAIVFDNSFLELLSPLLEKALDHPSPSILDPSISFWNSAFGDRNDLNFPPHLLPVLDKLSRRGKIKLKGKNAPALAGDDSSLEAEDAQHRSYKVASTLHSCSKRVAVLEKMMDGCGKKLLRPCPKRKRSELTEHQKEVRRAQQGKGRDCSGHGPGIRTYTSVDFSQGNDESQDSQDIRDPDLILDLLRKVA